MIILMIINSICGSFGSHFSALIIHNSRELGDSNHGRPNAYSQS